MKNFRLSDWANVAEICAAIAVIVSLIFIGLELQNNTKATQAAIRESINRKDLEFLSLRLDSSILARAHAKRGSGEMLSALEESQLAHQEYVNFILFEHSFYQFQKGILGPEEWARHKKIIRLQIENSSYAQIMWARKQNTFTLGFQDLVNSFAPDMQSAEINKQ